MTVLQSVARDERTVAVENASYRWAYAVLIYALLVDVMYRGWARNEAAWDLMAMVIVTGIMTGAYQARQQVLARGWVMKVALLACVAGVIAAMVAMAL
jgi:hypothetical protein